VDTSTVKFKLRLIGRLFFQLGAPYIKR